MEGQRNNKGIIVLLVVIIIMLSVFCVLFATGTISFNSEKVNNNTNESYYNVIEDNNSNNKISEWEIKEKFEYVYGYNVLPFVTCGETQTGMIKIGDKDYYMSNEFNTYDEMLSYLNKFMSKEVMSNKYAFKATDKNNYLEKDNNLYCEVTNKGYIYGHNVKDIEIVKEENNKVIFVGNMELIDPYDDNKQYDKVNCTIEYIDNNWIITSFEKQNN